MADAPAVGAAPLADTSGIGDPTPAGGEATVDGVVAAEVGSG